MEKQNNSKIEKEFLQAVVYCPKCKQFHTEFNILYEPVYCKKYCAHGHLDLKTLDNYEEDFYLLAVEHLEDKVVECDTEVTREPSSYKIRISCPEKYHKIFEFFSEEPDELNEIVILIDSEENLIVVPSTYREQLSEKDYEKLLAKLKEQYPNYEIAEE